MDDLRFVAERGNERFEITEGRGEGFYVYRFVDGESTHDYLQPDITLARDCAYDEWHVRDSLWRPPIDGEIALCHLCH